MPNTVPFGTRLPRHLSWPNVPESRGYGRRGSCGAGAVTDVAVGTVGWLGIFLGKLGDGAVIPSEVKSHNLAPF